MGQQEIIKDIWARWIQPNLGEGGKKPMSGVRILRTPPPTHTHTHPKPTRCYSFCNSHRSFWVGAVKSVFTPHQFNTDSLVLMWLVQIQLHV